MSLVTIFYVKANFLNLITEVFQDLLRSCESASLAVLVLDSLLVLGENLGVCLLDLHPGDDEPKLHVAVLIPEALAHTLGAVRVVNVT